MKKEIRLTRPNLPSKEDFKEYIDDLWESQWLTNFGKYHEKLEKELKDYLEVPYISLFNNGTIALMTALRALKVDGEVITTPFSFPATVQAILWNNLKPVFVDIDSATCNINPELIENAISDKTSAILPLHSFGNPCDVKKIQTIAEKYDLKVIYDAASCFGVTIDDKSILNFGDLSVLSFHATKIYNTFEGGAVICKDHRMYSKLKRLKNFGIINEEVVDGIGLNGKMNELQAILGLLNIKNLEKEKENRRILTNKYIEALCSKRGIKYFKISSEVKTNFTYFPILVEKDHYGETRDQLFNRFRSENILVRKYYYPLLTNILDLQSNELPNGQSISENILCLPMYSGMNEIDFKKVIDILINR